MSEETLPEITFSGDFPVPDEQEWLSLVEVALKGRAFDKALVSTSYDGIAVQPLYTSLPESVDTVPARQGPWDLRILVNHPDPEAASAEVDEHRRCGATSYLVKLASAPGKSDGLAVGDEKSASRFQIGDDVCVEAAGDLAIAQLALLDREAGRQEARLQAFRLDPLGSALRNTESAIDVTGFLRDIRPAVSNIDFVSLIADGTPYQEAGATDVQELAAVMASAVHYMRCGVDAGLDVQAAADAVRVRLTTNAELFMSIAKLRAGLIMWERILGASGAVAAAPAIEAISAAGMYTSRDPWVNILRGTAAGMAGAIGGAMNITVLPYSWAAGGQATGFAQSMARNIQVILNEESNLGAVCDPSAGSYAIEAITQEMADKAWALFQRIEAAGGIVAALKDGWLQDEIAEVAAAKRKDAARRKLPVTGVSEFPLLDEDPADIVEVDAVLPEAGNATGTGLTSASDYADIAAALDKGASIADVTSAIAPDAPVLSVPALTLFRPADAYEKLRDRSDEILAATGKRPSHFGAFIGPLADFTARATFTRNFLAAGGIEVADGPVDAEDAAIVAAFRDSGCREAVLCSSDDHYADRAAGLAVALKQAGAAKVWLAGRAGDNEAAFTAAGIDGYIYAGSDVVAFLEGAHARLAGDSK